METCVILGGAGFIGSNFIKCLLDAEKELKVVNIDKLTYAGSTGYLKAVSENDNYVFYKEDICSRQKIEDLFEEIKPDYAINFAAETHVDKSIEDGSAFVGTNVQGTQVLLQVSLKHNVKKFIQISTDEVYGPSKNGECFTEESPLKPGNPYAATKAAADLLALAYHNTYGLPVVITRSTNNFGPHQHWEKLIPLVIKHCLEGRRIPVYGDGRYMRDWIYVSDHCDALYKILKKGTAGCVYNISAGNEKENIEVVRTIIAVLQRLLDPGDARRDKINENLVEHVEDRKGHDRRYTVKSDKLRKSLGWSPASDFMESLYRTVKWYVDVFTASSGGKYAHT